MRRCLQLAKLGALSVSPNPMVGAVIVRHNQIIGEGFHRKHGSPHAEVHAIQSVEDKMLLEGATLYVNLEPCSHYGKTPPCANLIIQHKIPHVVIGTLDPNPIVAGSGMKLLIDAGVKVEYKILERECLELNRLFFVYHEKRRPFITLKWAESRDGFLDRDRNGNIGVNWITGEDARAMVHKLRAEHDAILVGKNTILNDDPSLTVRGYHGKNPIRVTFDGSLEIPVNKRIFDNSAPTWIINSKKSELAGTTEFIQLSFDDNLLPALMDLFYHRKVQSVLIEGGAFTINKMLELGLWDEIVLLRGKIDFHSGLRAPKPKGMLYSAREIPTARVEIYH